MWYMYMMEYYSATKKNEILKFATKWMELKIMDAKENKLDRKKNSTCFLSYGEVNT